MPVRRTEEHQFTAWQISCSTNDKTFTQLSTWKSAKSRFRIMIYHRQRTKGWKLKAHFHLTDNFWL